MPLFTPSSWTRAAAEILLIVAGVLIALAINAWYSDLVEKEEERLVLAQIATALRGDLDLLRQNLVDLRQSEQDILALLDAFDRNENLPESRSPKWRSIVVWRGIRFRSGPYEELKDHGFDLIRDPSLREQIIDLYEYHFPSLASVTENDRKYSMELVVPYFMETFHQGNDWAWDVGDSAAVRSDPYFVNLTLGKLQRQQNFLFPRYERAAEVVREVLAQIDSYLERG